MEVHFNMQFTRDEMIAFSTTKSQMNSLWKQMTPMFPYSDHRANRYGSTGSLIPGANASTHKSHMAPSMPIAWSVKEFLHSPHRLAAVLAKTLKYLMSGLHFVVSSFSYIGPVSGATIFSLLACQTTWWRCEGRRPASLRKWSLALRDTASEAATR